jgi:hypothetical protein
MSDTETEANSNGDQNDYVEIENTNTNDNNSDSDYENDLPFFTTPRMLAKGRLVVRRKIKTKILSAEVAFENISNQIGDRDVLDKLLRDYQMLSRMKTKHAIAKCDGILLTLIEFNCTRRDIKVCFKVGFGRLARIKAHKDPKKRGGLNGQQVTADDISFIRADVKTWKVEPGFSCDHRREKKYFEEEGVEWTVGLNPIPVSVTVDIDANPGNIYLGTRSIAPGKCKSFDELAFNIDPGTHAILFYNSSNSGMGHFVSFEKTMNLEQVMWMFFDSFSVVKLMGPFSMADLNRAMQANPQAKRVFTSHVRTLYIYDIPGNKAAKDAKVQRALTAFNARANYALKTSLKFDKLGFPTPHNFFPFVRDALQPNLFQPDIFIEAGYLGTGIRNINDPDDPVIIRYSADDEEEGPSFCGSESSATSSKRKADDASGSGILGPRFRQSNSMVGNIFPGKYSK